jgi:hypothetical protein
VIGVHPVGVGLIVEIVARVQVESVFFSQMLNDLIHDPLTGVSSRSA